MSHIKGLNMVLLPSYVFFLFSLMLYETMMTLFEHDPPPAQSAISPKCVMPMNGQR